MTEENRFRLKCCPTLTFETYTAIPEEWTQRKLQPPGR